MFERLAWSCIDLYITNHHDTLIHLANSYEPLKSPFFGSKALGWTATYVHLRARWGNAGDQRRLTRKAGAHGCFLYVKSKHLRSPEVHLEGVVLTFRAGGTLTQHLPPNGPPRAVEVWSWERSKRQCEVVISILSQSLVVRLIDISYSISLYRITHLKAVDYDMPRCSVQDDQKVMVSIGTEK